MGHKRLGYMPRTKTWRAIVDQLTAFSLGTAEVSSIAKNTLENVKERFSKFEDDPSVQSSFEFLLQVSYAFQKENPLQYLIDHRILEKEELTLIKLSRGIKNYTENDVVSHEYQTFARQATIDAINNWYVENLERGTSLFHSDVDSVSIFNKAADGSGFCELSRLFFSKFTERYLKYFLEREASSAIPNINERDKFSAEVEKHISQISKHAFETAKITQSFAAGWYTKNTKESFPEKKEIKNFLSHAFGKMRSELLEERVN